MFAIVMCIQSSLPLYQTQSHNAHLLSEESHLPTAALPPSSVDVFRSTMGYETSNVTDAARTKFNVAKSHEQYVANAALSEDLPSNPTLSAKLSSPISPNRMFSFLFINITHVYAKYRQKNNFYLIIVTLQLCSSETFLLEDILDSKVQITGFIIVRSDSVSRPGGGVCLYLKKQSYL